MPGPGLGAEVAGKMTQAWPFKETWEEEGAQEDGESGFGEARSLSSWEEHRV